MLKKLIAELFWIWIGSKMAVSGVSFLNQISPLRLSTFTPFFPAPADAVPLIKAKDLSKAQLISSLFR